MGTNYDAFISYTKHDQPWVETYLLPRLKAAGITYLDYQQFQLGAPKLNEIERAVLSSRKTLLVISQRYLQEDWQGFTSVLTSSYGLENSEWPAIPLLIEDCELPLRLKVLTELDLIQPTEADWNRLVTALHPTTQPPNQQTTQPTRSPIFHGVPAMPPYFVGRDELVQEMVHRLTRGESVSVSTDGQGGIGKTTLAVALARHPDVWVHFPDGVLWVGLGKNGDAMSALAAWGEALGQDFSSLTSIEDRRSRIENLIDRRRMLLVIDDAWEMDAANAMKCGGEHCTYLLTTRDKYLATQFAGRGQVETLPVLTDEAAWTLLQALAPEACAVDPNAARTLAEAVGGLPLALELLGGYLAAQEGALFPDLFPDLNQDALAELAEPRRRLQLATQRLGSKGGKVTLEQTLSLSLDDLPAEAKSAFYALGAFAHKPATFSREAAEAVAQTDGKTLALFASRNVLEVMETRFVLHQTLADIARVHMPADAQAHHRTFFLDLANDDRLNWRRIEEEFQQIWWGWEHNSPNETKLDWVWAIGHYMYTRGLWADYIQCGEIALRFVKDREDEGSLLNNLGLVYDNLGQRTKALEYYGRALPILEEVGDWGGLATTLNNLGLVYDNLGQRTKALENYERALPIFEEVGDRGGLARTLNNLGLVYANLGQREKALEYYVRALPIYEEVGDRGGLATTFNNLGSMYDNLGQREKALETYARALPILEEVGDRGVLARTLNNLGLVYANLGQRGKALEYYAQALPIYEEVGDRGGLAATFNNLGNMYDNLGQREKALEYYGRALPILEEVGDRGVLARTLNNLGLVYANLGQRGRALEYYTQALPILEEVGDRGGLARTLNNLGLVYANLGQREKALEYYGRALPIYEEVGDRGGLATTFNNLGSTYDDLGQREKALETYARALPILEEVGDRGVLARTLNNLGLVYANLGQREQALEYYAQALPIREEVGDRFGESITRYNFARIHQDEGRLKEALAELRKVVLLSEQFQSPYLERFQTELAQLEAELAARGSV